MEAITADREEPAVPIPQAYPVQVIGVAAMRNQTTGDGVDCSRDRPREGKGSNAGTGPKGDRGGSNVTILLLGGSKSKDREKPGGEAWTARKALLSGTPDRSNLNRELVKRKPSSDGGRRIRKRVRQLARASKGRRGAFAYRANPTEIWNKVARQRKGSRMWRLADGERSTRFESASQYSQLPLRAEQSRKTEESQGARCGPQGKHHAGTPERSNPNRELVKRKQF